MLENYDYLFKILIIGDSNVGKTCILYRLCEENFSTAFISTIGIDFKTKNMQIDDKIIKLQIWDTAGQERFRTITTAYYRGAMGVIVVFDVTNMNSFKSVRDWLKRVKEHANNDIDVLIIGNKADMTFERAVTFETVKNLTDSYGFKYLDVSALSGLNVKEAFVLIAKSIKDRMHQRQTVQQKHDNPSPYVEPRGKRRNILLKQRVQQNRNCC